MTFYCPGCWVEIPERARTCPFCGYDLLAYEALSYEDKMILALRHPIQDNRLVAIQALGSARYSTAIRHLAELLDPEEDYYIQREALLALSKFGTNETQSIIEQALTHPSKLVSKFAQKLLAQSVV